ncbi:LamG-like jellyroll fold domain-containing protein [Aeoliella sp.]|uniref:LamG-like jellyroll fold domain-containing protein n=1 Tax=Aeoliella sp. TaxID=2795800 RepID=UPI003CCC30BE
MSDIQHTDIRLLAQAVVEGQLESDQFGPLMQRLSSSEEDRESYIEYIQLHTLLDKELRDKQGTPPVLPTCPTTTPAAVAAAHSKGPSGYSRRLLAAAMTVACAIAIGLYLKRDVDAPPTAEEVAPPPVAYLASSNGCEWAGMQRSVANHMRIVEQGQELVLLEGIAEFRLASGVSLSVEGPATLVLNSPTDLHLEYGHLTFLVPWVVTDFKVQAAGLVVSACDAECGVNVSSEEISVHCFSGSATVLPDGKEGTEVIEVAASRSIYIASTPEQPDLPQLNWGKADNAQFATRLLMADRLPVSPKYIEEVLDDQPVGYWRFESQRDDTIQNEVADGVSLAVRGQLRLSDHEQNRVAEFGRPGSNCHLLSNGRLIEHGFDEYTVEFWAKPSHVHHGGMVSLVRSLDPESDALHGFHVCLNAGKMANVLSREHPYRLRYLHRNPPSSKYRTGTSIYSREPYSLRRWLHVVAAKKGPYMRLYVNKQVVAVGRDNTKLADDLYLLVGRTAHNTTAATFVGQLDELAIYGRTLETEEVASHYEAMWSEVENHAAQANDI